MMSHWSHQVSFLFENFTVKIFIKIFAGFSVKEYFTQEKLAAGGFGTVDMTKHVHIKVIKVTSTIAYEKMATELRSLQILSGHENILKYFLHELVQDDLLIYVEKYSETLIGKCKLDTLKTLDIIMQVAMGLEYAHSNGIIHGNVSPENIVVKHKNDKSIFKLANFESAFITNHETKTLKGEVFSAPEVVIANSSGKQHINDSKMDIFSLGAVFFWLLTGSTPFDIDDITQGKADSRAIVKDKIKDLELYAIFYTMLHIEARRRPKAQGVIVQLESLKTMLE